MNKIQIYINNTTCVMISNPPLVLVHASILSDGIWCKLIQNKKRFSRGERNHVFKSAQGEDSDRLHQGFPNWGPR